MPTLSSPEWMLKQIAQIRRMERGKLCLMRQGPSGPYYSHQTWQQGRNVVRYVPRDRVPVLQSAIAGYQEYLKLTQAYADLIIARTRQEQSNRGTHRPGGPKRADKGPPPR
jgi:hypothetical protein